MTTNNVTNEFSAPLPKTFWQVVGALIVWPCMLVALALAICGGLAFVALSVVIGVVACAVFIVLGIPVAAVFWAVGKILTL